ncbi:unnamed protein product [Prorocentrum cordatum]|uniref:Uncharacterized protein n=1 Tax=Prorocentrum cordatum TaxID=2364126 RepID=A0ABN9SM12_9DINO|nr:unnamed protein product [Polarella glacialis]|mmetsp:Transcript_22343/g.59555  ORF Transcript_22343/g.59555 Transcript_22343/m.59555 type:complete len:346 (+) Transcript_22343:122-1159(+)
MAWISPMVMTAFLATLSAHSTTGIMLKGSSTREAADRQKDHRRRHRELLSAVSGDCRCLNWKDVFTQRGVRCGQGYELFLPRSSNGTGAHLKTGLFQSLWERELCDRVFARLDTDGCLQQNMGEVSDSAQAGWCYVGSACSSDRLDVRRLSAAGAPPLRLRMCVPGADRFLYEKPPPDLQKFASAQGLDMGHLVKLSYPTMRDSWERVSSFFTLNRSLHTAEISARLRHTAQRGNTVVWSSRNGLPPFGVTQGLNAWEVGFYPHARRAVMSDPTSVQVWARVTKFRCVGGCSGVELPDDAPVVKLYERAGVFALGSPWARGRGPVQMHRRLKKRGRHRRAIQAQT